MKLIFLVPLFYSFGVSANCGELKIEFENNFPVSEYFSPENSVSTSSLNVKNEVLFYDSRLSKKGFHFLHVFDQPLTDSSSRFDVMALLNSSEVQKIKEYKVGFGKDVIFQVYQEKSSLKFFVNIFSKNNENWIALKSQEIFTNDTQLKRREMIVIDGNTALINFTDGLISLKLDINGKLIQTKLRSLSGGFLRYENIEVFSSKSFLGINPGELELVRRDGDIWKDQLILKEPSLNNRFNPARYFVGERKIAILQKGGATTGGDIKLKVYHLEELSGSPKVTYYEDRNVGFAFDTEIRFFDQFMFLSKPGDRLTQEAHPGNWGGYTQVLKFNESSNQYQIIDEFDLGYKKFDYSNFGEHLIIENSTLYVLARKIAKEDIGRRVYRPEVFVFDINCGDYDAPSR